MTNATYRNHQHYISEGWSREPKESFKALRAILEDAGKMCDLNVLDVGCATGELIGYLAGAMPGARFTGVDVSDDLLQTARNLLPKHEFRKASALSLPSEFSGQFDVVCAVGCMSIFDETGIDLFWDNLLAAAKPDGMLIVLSPLNEYGVDTMIRHRKRLGGQPGTWETGWNIHSTDTIRELLSSRNCTLRLQRFELPFDLPPKADLVRTWTMRTQDRERQLTNGLKLLVDHYFMIVSRG